MQSGSDDTADEPSGNQLADDGRGCHGGTPDPVEQRQRFTEWLREAGTSVKRYIDVHDGAKGSTDHTQRPPNDGRLQGNYGVYGGLGGDADVPAKPEELADDVDPYAMDVRWLVDIDVDDYEHTDDVPTDGLDSLPETFTVESPHTDGETGGHRYYVVEGHVARAIHDAFGVKNPSPKWGEVRIYNQYCVGPGSQIQPGGCVHEWCDPDDGGCSGCDKDWCDACAEPDGGYYRIANDCEIATLDLTTFVEAIRTDLPDRRTETQSSGADGASGQPQSTHDVEPGPGLPPDVDVEERLETALERDETLRHLWHGRYAAAGYPNDRSDAEYVLAGKLGWWFGQCPDTVRRLMDQANTQKWCERPDASYRDSIMSVVGGEDYYEGDREPVATLPVERLNALDRDEQRRYAKQRGRRWPSTDEVRGRLQSEVFQSMRASETVVIGAPTSIGKSWTIATEPWLRRTDITGDGPVIHLAPTRDARDENAAASSQAGVQYATLKGRSERCPMARGDHDPNPDGDDPNITLTVSGAPVSHWMTRQCDEKGLPFQLVHSYAAELNDQGEPAPCTTGECECPAHTQWNGVPRDNEGNAAFDVVHATHPFAYVPSLRRGCHVVLDEAVDFTINLEQERIQRAVTAYLRTIDAPVTTWAGLLSLAEFEGGQGDAAAEQDELEAALGETPKREWYVHHPDAHALAPDLAEAIYHAIRWEEPDANGRRSRTTSHVPPRFDEDDEGDGEGYGCNWLTVVIDDEHTVRTVRHAPDFSPARSVIGLDAHPTPAIWQRNVGPQMTVRRIMEPDERQLWRRLERGLTVVQVGDATRPLSGGNARDWFESDRKLPVELEALREHYGEDFRTAITTSQVEGDLRRRMIDAGVEDPETMHYGEEKSRNDFGDEAVGLITGCMDPGDDYVLDLLAELELEARPERVNTEELADPAAAHCKACGGDGCSECGDTGVIRAGGREFVGPDADTAAELLASVRENHIAQAAGRYARSPDDPENTAIVYVRTDATPTGFVDCQVSGAEWLATDLQREIVDTLRETSASTIRELSEAANCTKEHVRQTLVRLEKREIVTRRRGTGDHGADEFQAYVDSEGIDDVDLTKGETANSDIWGVRMWELAISVPQPMVTVLDRAKRLWPPRGRS